LASKDCLYQDVRKTRDDGGRTNNRVGLIDLFLHVIVSAHGSHLSFFSCVYVGTKAFVAMAVEEKRRERKV
jgi:hypothetical protein